MSTTYSENHLLHLKALDTRLEEWRRERLPMSAPLSNMTPEQNRAVMGHLLRNLSRGRIPPLKPMLEYLEGKAKLPSCGYIGCIVPEEDHVH
jgi:hypothetical protein